MPFRSPKMYSFIFGFQRRTWWPKCTPASNNSFIVTVTKQLSPLCQLVYVLAATGVPKISGQPIKIATMEFRFRISKCEMRIGETRVPEFESAIRNSQFSSPLRELEALARALLSVLLAFLDAGIACDQACVF